MLFVEYPKCSTCRRAKKWRDSHGLDYTDRNIADEKPTYEELKGWQEKSGLSLRKFFNTSGLLYKSMNLKEKLPTMSDEEKYELLGSNGMLVKRPVLIDGDKILLGFKAEKWKEQLR